ncbi:MAG: sigma-70 family RNA polymerase sigma factor [Acidimicrobiales bacterium]
MADDEALLRACRAGDDRAWRTLVDRYVRLVHAIPLHLGLDHQDAEDIVQLTFSALLAGLDQITEPDRLSAWLSTVARRQSFRTIQRRQRERPGEPEALETEPFDGSVAQRRVEDIEWLHQGLGRLDDRCRALLVALYFSGPARPYTDIAAEIGMPVGSLGPTRARCLQKLRTHLEELRHP